MTDDYEAAVAKIVSSENAKNGAEDAEIAFRGNPAGSFFEGSSYNKAIASIEGIANAGGDKAAAALGIQTNSRAEAAKKKVSGKFGAVEREIENMFEEIKRTIGRGAGKAAAAGPSSMRSMIPKKEKAQMSLGKLLSGKIGKGKAAKGSAVQTRVKLSDLPIADQIAELEKIAMTHYDKSGDEEGTLQTRKEVEELAKKAGKETVRGSGFEMKMIELRNQRLHEVVGILGLDGIQLNK